MEKDYTPKYIRSIVKYNEHGLSANDVIKKLVIEMSYPRDGGKHKKAIRLGLIKKDNRRNYSIKFYKGFLNFLSSLTTKQYEEIVTTKID